MGMGKIIVVSVVTLSVLGAGAVGFLQTDMGKRAIGRGSDQQDLGTPVRFETAELGDLKRTISAPGSIDPRTDVQISSQVSAKVLALPFREGDMVKAGDVVVRLDPQDLIAALDSAKAGLKRQRASLMGSEASLINARLQYERLQSLYETGDATKAELDSAEASFLQAEANKAAIEASIEEAQARIDDAEQDLDNINITTSIDGVITALNTEIGETVIVGTTNNAGSVIMEIADLSEMILKASIDETNIAPVEVGQAATIYINAYTGREYTGTVKRIGLKRQVSSDGTGSFQVEIPVDIPEGESLYAGLTASTDIAVENYYDAIKVPSQAVLDRRIEDLPEEIRGSEFIDPEKTFARVVYTVTDGKTVAQPVQTGASDLTHTVITGGLEAGERVVAGPYRVLVSLEHDKPVRDIENMGRDNKESDDDNNDAQDAEDSEGSNDASSQNSEESDASQDNEDESASGTEDDDQSEDETQSEDAP